MVWCSCRRSYETKPSQAVEIIWFDLIAVSQGILPIFRLLLVGPLARVESVFYEATPRDGKTYERASNACVIFFSSSDKFCAKFYGVLSQK